MRSYAFLCISMRSYALSMRFLCAFYATPMQFQPSLLVENVPFSGQFREPLCRNKKIVPRRLGRSRMAATRRVRNPRCRAVPSCPKRPQVVPNVSKRSQAFPNRSQLVPNVPKPSFIRSRLKHMPFFPGNRADAAALPRKKVFWRLRGREMSHFIIITRSVSEEAKAWPRLRFGLRRRWRENAPFRSVRSITTPRVGESGARESEEARPMRDFHTPDFRLRIPKIMRKMAFLPLPARLRPAARRRRSLEKPEVLARNAEIRPDWPDRLPPPRKGRGQRPASSPSFPSGTWT